MEKMEQKMSEWVKKEFEPEKAQRILRHLPIISSKHELTMMKLKRIRRIEIIVEVLIWFTTGLFMLPFFHLMPVKIIFPLRILVAIIFPLTVGFLSLYVSIMFFEKLKLRKLIGSVPFLLLSLGFSIKSKEIPEHETIYLEIFDYLAESFYIWLKNTVYRYVVSELNQFRNELLRLRKIILLVPNEEISESEIPKKLLELSLALEEKNIPEIYSLTQKLKEIRPDISYDHISKREKLYKVLKEILGIISSIIVGVMSNFLLAWLL